MVKRCKASLYNVNRALANALHLNKAEFISFNDANLKPFHQSAYNILLKHEACHRACHKLTKGFLLPFNFQHFSTLT